MPLKVGKIADRMLRFKMAAPPWTGIVTVT